MNQRSARLPLYPHCRYGHAQAGPPKRRVGEPAEVPDPRAGLPSRRLPVVLCLAVAAALLLASPPAAAQLPDDGPPAAAAPGGPPGPPSGPQWTLGVGVIASPEPYRGIDGVDEQVIPVVTLRWGRFSFEGVQARYRLFERGPWEGEAVAQVRFLGYEAEDSPFLEGMEDRDPSLDGGFRVTFQPGPVGARLALLHDLLDESGGAEARLTLFRDFQVRRWRLTPQVEAAWQSDELVDHYYGVRPQEARPGRPAFAPGAAPVFGAGVQAFWFGPGRWAVFAFVQQEWLGGDVGDSPIVASDDQLSGLVAVTYRF